MLRCLSHIELICYDPKSLAAFYEAAFGFVTIAEPNGVSDPASGSLTLRLGQQIVRLIRPPSIGRAYPAGVAGWSPLFQHIAIVASDMASAYARLCSVPGWSAISASGPQVLPAASGGVIAFKFRDPEGHPLELIAFAPGATPVPWRQPARNGCLGIDHSAVSVSNTLKSVAFYEALGLHRSGGSLNVGREQAELDDVRNAEVEVTALSPVQSTPHVELLCYLGDFDRNTPSQAVNDMSATRLVFMVENLGTLEAICSGYPDKLLSAPVQVNGTICSALLRDPDGHLVALKAEG